MFFVPSCVFLRQHQSTPKKTGWMYLFPVNGHESSLNFIRQILRFAQDDMHQGDLKELFFPISPFSRFPSYTSLGLTIRVLLHNFRARCAHVSDRRERAVYKSASPIQLRSYRIRVNGVGCHPARGFLLDLC